MRKIIIQLTELSDTNWRLIFQLIEKCHHRGDFNEETYNLLITNAKISCHTVEKKEDALCASDDTLSYSSFVSEVNTGSKIVIGIIYNKKDESADFSVVMPFIYWIEQSAEEERGDVSLGIDISKIQNKNEYKFKFGQLLINYSLPEPLASIRSLYFIDISSTGVISSVHFPYKANGYSTKSTNTSRRFLSILKIDSNSLELFNEKTKTIQKQSETYKWIEESIQLLNDEFPNKKIDIPFHSLFEEWFFKAFLYSYKEEGCPYKDKIKALSIELHEYCNNIYELVQNIIFHTEQKKGLLYVVFNKKKNISPLIQAKIPHIETYDNEDRFVEIEIYDWGNIGIAESFGENTTSLTSFFDPKVLLPDGNIRYEYLTLRYAAHMGIKTFVASILSNDGYFCAETNNPFGSKDIIESSKGEIMQPKQIKSLNGTHYKIVLPVKMNRNPQLESVHSSSIIEILKKHLCPFENIPLIQYPIIAPKDGKQGQIEEIQQIGEEIIACYRTSTRQLDNIAIDLNGAVKSSNHLLKLIVYLQCNIPQTLEKIIFINVDSVTVNSICKTIKNLCDIVSPKNQPIWSEERAVVLIDYEHRVHILCGETESAISYINREINSFFYGSENMLNGLGNPSQYNSKKNLERFVLPYDCLVGEVQKSQNCFINYVSRVLDNPIEGEDIGCKVDMPTKIGSKIYIDHYYEADFLLQNSFFADRFAFFAANEILQALENNTSNIILFGYKHYSELLINRIKTFIQSKRKAECHLCIVEDTEASRELKFKLNHNVKEKGGSYDAIIVVPIASTLTTFGKIISNYNRQSQKDGSQMPSCNFIFNYCTLLIRDDTSTITDGGNITEMEKERGWEDVTNNIVKTNLYNTKEVHFLLSKQSKWHNLIDEDTFPSSENGPDVSNYSKEKYINQTRNSALNIKDYVRYPVAAIPPNKDNNGQIHNYYDFTIKRLKDMQDYIYYGHIIHNNDHHRYYFDIRNYLGDFKEKTKKEQESTRLYKWINNFLKKEAETSFPTNKLNVIVSPGSDDDPHFTDIINKYLFNDNAYVLFLNIADYRQNYKAKYSFLKHSEHGSINDGVYYHYIDHALVTGKSYQKAKSFMAAILERPNFKFHNIITIINRLSKDKYNEIARDLQTHETCHIFSFNHFFILPSKLPDTDCSLCKLNRYFSVLKKHSVIKNCRDVIEENRYKYKECIYESNSKNDSIRRISIDNKTDERAWKRMIWRHRLFYEISNICGYKYVDKDINQLQKEIEKKLDDLYYRDCVSVDDKISFLKAISFPPLSEYVRIRAYAFRLMLTELKNTLDKKEPQLYDLFLLKVLLKHLALLGSNALVRRDVIIGAWRLYKSVREQLHTEIIQTKKRLKELEELRENLNDTKETQGESKQLTLFSEKDNNSGSKVENKNNYFEIERKALKTKLDYIKVYTGLDDKTYTEDEIVKIIKGENKLNAFIDYLHFYIKIATHNDEAKSLWLGELLRTGEEMRASRYGIKYKAHSTKLHNNFFNVFNTESEPYFSRELLPLLFYDNTSIIRSTLDNFEKEKNKKAETIEDYKSIIHDNYYYSWVRHFFKEDGNIIIDESPDGICLIKKYLQILSAKAKLNEFLNQNPQIESFDNNAKHLLNDFAEIMEASAAFIAIKPKGNNQIYTLADYISDDHKQNFKDIKYDIFYCKKLLFGEDFREKNKPFIIKRGDEISQYGESFDGKYNKATFLALNKNQAMDKCEGKEIDVLVGMVVFLYNDNRNDTKFTIESKELGRLLLLLKPEIDRYVTHIAAERQFDVWVAKLHLAQLTYDENHSLTLGGWDFENLPEAQYISIYNGIITFSDLTIRHLYATLINEGKITLRPESIPLSDIFNPKFVALLQKIAKEKTAAKVTIGSVPNDLYINGLKPVLQSFIILLLKNANSHADSKQVNILFTDEYFEIKNDINKSRKEMEENKKKFDSKYNEESMDLFIKQPKQIREYGFTLLTLHYYIDSLGMQCKMEYNIEDPKPYFSIKIYYKKNKNK